MPCGTSGSASKTCPPQVFSMNNDQREGFTFIASLYKYCVRNFPFDCGQYAKNAMAFDLLNLVIENTHAEIGVPRSIVDDATVAALQGVIKSARVAGGEAAMPNDPRYTFLIRQECPGAAEFAVFGPSKPQCASDQLSFRNEVMLVHSIVAWTDQGERKAIEWQGGLSPEPESPVALADGGLPCCVTRFSSTETLADTRWLGDVQMCFAWAWIEGA